jgi:hypothetical protein
MCSELVVRREASIVNTPMVAELVAAQEATREAAVTETEQWVAEAQEAWRAAA